MLCLIANKFNFVIDVQVCRVFKSGKETQNLGDEGPTMKFDQVKRRYRLEYATPEEYLIGKM